MPLMGLQEALSGQPPLWALGLQIRAHWVGWDEPAISRTHSGRAVVPLGTSDGQGEEAEQAAGDTLGSVKVIRQHQK